MRRFLIKNQRRILKPAMIEVFSRSVELKRRGSLELLRRSPAKIKAFLLKRESFIACDAILKLVLLSIIEFFVRCFKRGGQLESVLY